MDESSANVLLAAPKPTESSLQVALHPLPILEISDYITRAYQRRQGGAIIGALLGQQHGQEVTIEHSFTCRTLKDENGDYNLDSAWFSDRLEQMLAVHSAPPLSLVGWYALVPKSGPTISHLHIHSQFMMEHNEAAVLLGFHTENVLAPVAGDPLPLTIYECTLEPRDGTENAPAPSAVPSEDQEMEDPDIGIPRGLVAKFRALPFTTETGDAEMIAMQFIREGGANATSQASQAAPAPSTKGKQKEVAKKEQEGGDKTADRGNDDDVALSKEESEQISALQAKASAIKMMKNRLGIIIGYLEELPSDSSANASPGTAPGGVTLSHNIVRQIQALVTNVELAALSQQDALEKEILQESNDIALIGLVKDLMTSIEEVRDVGKKSSVVEANKPRVPRSGHSDLKSNPSYSLGTAVPDYL